MENFDAKIFYSCECICHTFCLRIIIECTSILGVAFLEDSFGCIGSLPNSKEDTLVNGLLTLPVCKSAGPRTTIIP